MLFPQYCDIYEEQGARFLFQPKSCRAAYSDETKGPSFVFPQKMLVMCGLTALEHILGSVHPECQWTQWESIHIDLEAGHSSTTIPMKPAWRSVRTVVLLCLKSSAWSFLCSMEMSLKLTCAAATSSTSSYQRTGGPNLCWQQEGNLNPVNYLPEHMGKIFPSLLNMVWELHLWNKVKHLLSIYYVSSTERGYSTNDYLSHTGSWALLSSIYG